MLKKGEFVYHTCKDISALTPYEQKIFELRQQGKTWDEIAKEVGKAKPTTIAARYHTVIKDKINSMQWEKQK